MSKIAQKRRAVPASPAVNLTMSPAITRIAVIIIALIFTWIIGALFNNSLSVFETRMGNIGWTLSSDQQTESRVLTVAIDEKSIAQIGPWPWPRKTLAELSNALKTAGVGLQLYDIVLPEAKPGDEALVRSLLTTPSVISQVPVMNSEQRLQSGFINQNIQGMRCQQPIPSTHNYLANHANFANISKGHITPVLDTDGAINQLAPLICVEGQVYPSLALSGLLKAAGIDKPSIEVKRGTQLLSSEWVITIKQYPGLEIPIDKQGYMRISYRKNPSVYQVISAVDILKGQVDSTLLDGTWVQVGATAFGLGDIVPTPYSGMAPGIELQSRLLTSLIDNDVPYTPAIANYLLLGMTLLFIAILYSITRARGKISAWGLPIAGVVLPLLAWGIHIQLLNHANLWLGWLFPAVFAVLGSTLLSLLEHNRTRIEQLRVYNNLDSYLPLNAANKIAYNLPSNLVEVERLECVLLSADIRNFSAYSESSNAESSVNLLHDYFERSCEIIERFEGAVHELKGDALLATWTSDNVDKALVAAQTLQVEISALFESYNLVNSEPLALGIGIEQGPVLVGSIGPAHCRSHSVLGRTVTKVLRIQEMTADLAQPILIGQQAAQCLEEKQLESQGDFLLAGLQKPHRLYAPLTGRMDDSTDTAENSPKLRLLQGNLS